LLPDNFQIAFGYGTVSTPTCDKEAPAQVVLYEPGHYLLPKATGVGEVRLNWLKADRATKYTLGFGVQPGIYIYGLPDVGDTDHFTVQHLNPGTKYYFAVRGVNDCKPGAWSREWATVVGRGGAVTTVSTTTTGTTTGTGLLPRKVIQPKGVVPTTVVEPTTVTQPEAPVVPVVSPKLNLWQRILKFFGF